MANELVAHAGTGLDLYVLVLNSTGGVWNGLAFETPENANWSNYSLTMSEAGTTGIYRVSMPAVDAGPYSWLVYRQAGAVPAVGDAVIGAGTIRWTGTAEEAAAPSAATVASAVRTELTTELGRVDATISSRASQTSVDDLPTNSELTAALAGVSASIDPQDVADAMALATVETPEAGSVLAELAAVRAITDDLDVTAVTQVVASSAGHLTITAGLTFDETVSGLIIPSDWAAAIWTLKRSAAEDDDAALVRLRASNPADLETDGLEWLNGAAPASPLALADGSLTVDQAAGSIAIWLSDELTAALSETTGLGWDVKFIDDAGDSSGRRGTADVMLTETWATA